MNRKSEIMLFIYVDPEVASTVVDLLMDFLGDTNVAPVMDVVVFVRDIIETNPKLHVSIITRLMDTFFYQICTARCLGDLPFYTIYEDGGGQE
ncbi:coatomer subunit beta-1-like [Trifolium medium]|uniref:Coatomer subunit beta-1-like n=1 Tax=Trifolium medium TaxID=97028 RepID=A0A392NG04_9FABA|nr:coatomer subunit beta-1-like [Trifolium medium]